MKVLVFISFTALCVLTLRDDNDDKECEESFLCSPSESCEFYQTQVTQIQKARNAETKREIFTNLRYAIYDNIIS